MRRKEREVTQPEELLAIISECKVCRVAIHDEPYPYIVPLNFGYSYNNNQLIFYFHTAKVGKKIELFKKNPHVCIELDTNHELVSGDIACKYTYKYQSIIGFGKVEFVEDSEEKINALNHLMKHQTNSDETFTYSPKQVEMIGVIKIVIDSFQGKQS
jgi:nitroimidazol reductase NimA-like FMN-containing flavoprotein (pyridoxamine 5'-phosphate oxidase superfamily)